MLRPRRPPPGARARPRKSSPIDESRLLSALLSSPTTVLIAADVAGAITRWSAGASQLYGWTADEVLGLPVAQLLPPERADELALRARLLAGEAVAPFETVRMARDGTRLPVEVHLVVMRDDAGQPTGMIALHRDLRRAREAEQALDASQQELRAAFTQSAVPQARLSLDGQVLAVNAALTVLVSLSAEALVGRDGVAFVDEERGEIERDLTRLATGEVTFLQVERRIRGGAGPVSVLVTVTPVTEADGTRVLAAAFEDVTELTRTRARLQEEAERFDALVQTMPVAVFTYDLDGICTSSRGQALSAFGYVDHELVGRSLLEMYAHDPAVSGAIRESLEGRGTTLRAEKVDRSWETHYRAMHDAAGRVVGGLGISLDLTARAVAEREVAANEARLRSLLQHATDVAMVLDLKGRIVFASAAVREQLGYDESELFWQDARSFNHPDDHELVTAAWVSVLDRPGATARLECRVLHADGTWRWADHVLTNLLDDPAVGGVVINVRETTERRRAEEELRRLAVRDGLTGLANRTLLLDRAEQSLVAEQRSGSATGVVVLDVVGMKALNDRLGQDGGDEVLRAIAGRLEAVVRSADTVARIAGDEFAILVVGLTSEEELRAYAATLTEVMDEPVEVAAEQVAVALRAGTSLSPAPDAGALLATAERASRIARAEPTAVLRAMTAGGAGAESEQAQELRQAIARRELVVHYQPVLQLDTDEVVAAEALVRWQHPERGLLPPAEFIPFAESSGLISELGSWVLREACAQLGRWRDAGLALSVSINLSPRQLVDSGFPQLVREVLRQTNVSAPSVFLEVTESALMDDAGAPEVLRTLHAMGVRLSLDDFGTGYSSLTYLKRFPVDAIKIDRSFVAGLGRDADDDAIVASVVSLARAVGKDVVAEGVETSAQLDALRALGVDQAQGFLWSAAVPAATLEAWVAQPRATPSPVPRPPAPALPQPPASSGADEQRILELHADGASLHTIAAALNAEGRRTPAGPRWTTKTVARVVAALVPPV